MKREGDDLAERIYLVSIVISSFLNFLVVFLLFSLGLSMMNGGSDSVPCANVM